MKIKYKTQSDLEHEKLFVDACDASISGQKGSNQFYGVACRLVQEFPLDVAQTGPGLL